MNELLNIQDMIFEIRGQRVMIDRDLAYLYRVPTKALYQAVKRNMRRFPEDFMFRLLMKKRLNWSQIVTGYEISSIQVVTLAPSRKKVFLCLAEYC